MSFDHLHPSISFEGETLNRHSSKIDVIVPILNLEGDVENFILDLHYSLNNQRYWPAGAIVSICDDLLTGIEENRALILSELAERLPQWSAVEILEAWEADILKLIGVANKSAPERLLSWIRQA